MKSFEAKVIAGDGRGKKIGFPTANLDKTDLDIDFGVYLAAVRVEGKNYCGLLHFGPRKTFDNKTTAELHIKDFSGNICGREIKVGIARKIRGVKKFDSIEDLKNQIAKDMESIA